MSENNYRDKVVDEVTDKVMQKPSISADESEVRERAEEAVDDVLDAPVQTFAPLLAENDVVTQLHQDASAETR